MILFSEVGDKTFLVAALMAMKHDRMVVFSAAFGALFVMTVLSAVLGHTVPTLLPKRFTSLAASILFLVFGAKLLHEGMQMDPNEGVGAEMSEVEQELAMKEKEMGRSGNGNLSDSYAMEMGLGGGRQPRSRNQLASPPRSPSQSPARPSSSHGVSGALHGMGNLLSLLLSPAWVQTFVMTFLGEWGDRSQIATIAMAAGQDYWWVTLGAVCGHAVCTGAAVIGGRAIAGRVSLKVGTCYVVSLPLLKDESNDFLQSPWEVPLRSLSLVSSTSSSRCTDRRTSPIYNLQNRSGSEAAAYCTGFQCHCIIINETTTETLFETVCHHFSSKKLRKRGRERRQCYNP